MKTFGFTWIKEGIGSSHRGILGTNTTNSTSKITQAQRQSMVEKTEDTIYQRLYVSEERPQEVIEYEERCQIKSNKGYGGPHWI